jgi:hypothetical protein
MGLSASGKRDYHRLRKRQGRARPVAAGKSLMAETA